MGSNDAVVLVVDDDPQIRSVFSGYLEDEFEVWTAASGPAALEAMSDDVDAVLLDRPMPEMSGEETLSALREAGFDQPVAIVTAVEPDFDVLDMGFDTYVVKPVFEDELQSIVGTLLLRREFDEVIREYVALVSKVTALHRGKSEAELDGHAGYEDSVARIEEIKAEAKKALDVVIETGKFDEVVRELEGGDLDLEPESSGRERPEPSERERFEEEAPEEGSTPDWRPTGEPRDDPEEPSDDPEEPPDGDEIREEGAPRGESLEEEPSDDEGTPEDGMAGGESAEEEDPREGTSEEEPSDEGTRAPDS